MKTFENINCFLLAYLLLLRSRPAHEVTLVKLIRQTAVKEETK